ncbi:MAG: ATP-binding protein [Pyrinomonadaceae bacterium]
MTESVRARLTLWYTGVLGLVLITFAFLSYSYLARTTRQRTDRSLSEIANSVAASFAAEYKGEEKKVTDAAAAETAREFRYTDRNVTIFDEFHRAVATSPPVPAAPEESPFASSSEPPAPLLQNAARDGSAYATLPNGEAGTRAYAALVHVGKRPYLIVITLSLSEQEEALEQTRRALYIVIPLALLLASLGGYFLARKSLAPVVAMSETAAQIGATNLHERLAVANERDELGQLAQVFNGLLERLDFSFDQQRRSFEQQRRFMADASHELRTPVAIVCGEAGVTLSREDRSADDYRESLTIVQDEGRRLKDIVEDLFTLARADAGQYPLKAEDFYLDELVSECARAVRSLTENRGLALCCKATEESPVHGDEGLIRRMMLNLLDNAIKNTPAEGTVSITLTQQGNEYAITVADTGTGISVAAQSHIFERFYRADKTRARPETDGASGAGLGLSISRWIAEAHHGRLDLLRSDESGSIFVAKLPVPEARSVQAENNSPN